MNIFINNIVLNTKNNTLTNTTHINANSLKYAKLAFIINYVETSSNLSKPMCDALYWYKKKAARYPKRLPHFVFIHKLRCNFI